MPNNVSLWSCLTSCIRPQKVGVVLFSLLISNDFHLSFVGVFWASGYIQLALTCLSQFPVLERSASFMKWSIFNLDSNRCDSNPSKANVECECLSCLHHPITSPFCNKFGRLNDIALNLGNESQWVSLSQFVTWFGCWKCLNWWLCSAEFLSFLIHVSRTKDPS